MAKNDRHEARRGSFIVAVDLGGTKILASVVDEQGRLVSEAKQKTRSEKGPDGVIRRIAQTAELAVKAAKLKWADVCAVGIGAPGPVDPEKGIVYHPPNLSGWQQVPIGPRLSSVLHVPVFLENDVNLGSLGEYALGAGRGTEDMIAIFVGTGVGGGVILDGKLRSGCRHAAGEVGHMVVLADGPVCGCGRRGCLESLASRSAIERDITGGLAAGRQSLLRELVDKDSKELTSGTLARALEKGDPLVTEVVSRAQWYLGLATASIVNLLDPEMVVFGGGLAEAFGAAFLEPIQVTARQFFIQQTDADQVQIVLGRLGDHATILGAAAYARQHLA